MLMPRTEIVNKKWIYKLIYQKYTFNDILIIYSVIPRLKPWVIHTSNKYVKKKKLQ